MSSTSNTIPSKVAIIGRPNVGKSSLFNVLVKHRRSLVKNESGVTRDIIIEPAEWWGRRFDVVDTGGLTEAKDTISQLIREQIVSLLKSFDALIVVMDGKSGLVPEDKDVVRMAMESGLPYALVVNKIDSWSQKDLMLSEFYEFGETLFPCSFEKRDGVDEVVEWIRATLPEDKNSHFAGVRLAIVGKPNVGKSSLCNYLLNEKRMLVSDIAGTTMDSIELPFKYNNNDYLLVDTAGLRRPSKRDEGLERIAAVKSHNAIDRADIVLLLVDGLEDVSHQDARMVEYILERHKAVILVINKSDLGKSQLDEFRKTHREQIAQKFHFFPDIPTVFISAKTGAGVKNLFADVDNLWQKLNKRITTSKLNNFFYEVIRAAPAPVWATQDVKFYYLTQTHQKPPSFIAFANHPQGVTPSYRRFLAKNIRENFDLKGVPIRIFVMGSK
ncbi:MAG: ribosome biogenesis GTPase Der [Bdellovibrionaceae bacterium]|nr:ribosome biogenesis GTPase Der [Pseudobdellovibrionaceae bacterium]